MPRVCDFTTATVGATIAGPRQEMHTIQVVMSKNVQSADAN